MSAPNTNDTPRSFSAHPLSTLFREMKDCQQKISQEERESIHTKIKHLH